MMVGSVLLHHIAIIIAFVNLIQAQRRDEGFNSYGGQPQNTQTGQRNQPPPQFNGQQRWTPPINNAGANQQSYNNGFQRPPPGTLGADSNRYNGQFQQGPPRATNNIVNRPYNVAPRPLETTGNGYNRPPISYGGYQRRPQLSPESDQNRQAVNGPQRPFIAIDNNRPNSQLNNDQPQRVANDYGQNRPYVFNQQRPSFANDNLRNRQVYYGGPQRVPGRAARNDSNAPIYIRRAQRPLTPRNNEINRPIYNVGGPIRVLDNESNKPINLNGFQRETVPTSDAGLNKQTNLEDLSRDEPKETENDSDTNGGSIEIGNNAPSGTPSTTSDQLKSVSEQPKSSTTSSDSKTSSVDINKDSNSSTSNGSTLLLIENSDKTTEPENSTPEKQKPINKLETTTPSDTEDEKTDSSKEISSEKN